MALRQSHFAGKSMTPMMNICRKFAQKINIYAQKIKKGAKNNFLAAFEKIECHIFAGK